MFNKLILGLMVITLTSCGFIRNNPVSYPTPIPNGPREDALGGKQVGDLFVWLYSNPDPPVRGKNEFEVFVSDIYNQPITNAKLSFDLDMTNMSHGKNIVPAKGLDDGFYVGSVSFVMPGPWRVILTIELEGQPSTVRFDFNVR
jgi:hypothetical protein